MSSTIVLKVSARQMPYFDGNTHLMLLFCFYLTEVWTEKLRVLANVPSLKIKAGPFLLSNED